MEVYTTVCGKQETVSGLLVHVYCPAMRPTRGELVALAFLAVVVIGFMPPVMTWVVSVDARVMGVPFVLFWVSAMVVVTSLAMVAARIVKDRIDRR